MEAARTHGLIHGVFEFFGVIYTDWCCRCFTDLALFIAFSHFRFVDSVRSHLYRLRIPQKFADLRSLALVCGFLSLSCFESISHTSNKGHALLVFLVTACLQYVKRPYLYSRDSAFTEMSTHPHRKPSPLSPASTHTLARLPSCLEPPLLIPDRTTLSARTVRSREEILNLRTHVSTVTHRHCHAPSLHDMLAFPRSRALDTPFVPRVDRERGFWGTHVSALLESGHHGGPVAHTSKDADGHHTHIW